MTPQAVNPRLVRCSVCNKDLPMASFHPSMVGPTTKQTQCRPCLAQMTKERNRQKRLAVYETLRAAFGDREWTAVEAADAVRAKRTGMGAMLEALQRDGFVRRLGVGRYVFSDHESSEPAEPTQAQKETAPTPSPRAASTEQQFLEVGTHIFSPPFTIIQDDRGRAAIILPVAETDSRTGHTSPMTVNFTAEEWAVRRIISMGDLVSGGRVDLFERVAELERDNERLRKDLSRERADKEAAMSLAEESARKLATVRASLSL